MLLVILKLAPEVGIEPTTNGLTVRGSAAELLWNKTGRGRGIRTLDLLLPKQAL